MTENQLKEGLGRPFRADELEWRLQSTSKDNTRGIAVPYITNRAIMNRLDEVCGPMGWRNEFVPWHDGNKPAQLCGISIWQEGTGWVTKWDGAEDTDIEGVKGGLSDAMKRAAVQWGMGRLLYEMDTVWVDVEPRGRSYAMKTGERAKCDEAYNRLLRRIGGGPTYETPEKAAPKRETRKAAEPVKNEKPAEPAPSDTVDMMFCADCGKPIEKHGKYGVMEIAQRTLAGHGRPLCWDCATKASIEKGKETRANA